MKKRREKQDKNKIVISPSDLSKYLNIIYLNVVIPSTCIKSNMLIS